MAYAFVGVISLLIQHHVAPFSEGRLNALESVSLFLLICISQLLTSYTPPWDDRIEIALFVMIVPFSFVNFCFVLHKQLTSFQSKRYKSSASSPSTAQFRIHPTYPRRVIKFLINHQVAFGLIDQLLCMMSN
jgi:hypothetical protein